MFEAIAEKMTGVLSGLSGKKQLSEENISDAVRQVRLALLEADVNYGVVKDFIKKVKIKALGKEIVKSVSAGQQFIKIIHDELADLMGGEEAVLDLKKKPSVIVLCGLQGSGKTTQCAKLARYLKNREHNKKPLLVACDLQRPAAVQQLKVLGEKIDVPVFSVEGQTNPVKVAKAALKEMKKSDYDVIIVDTAGRLHVDNELMSELKKVCDIFNPDEVLFVANAATGQDAVNAAAEFNNKIAITGNILTMLDGNTRGGAAISITEVTGKPLKFEGIGERLEDLQLFNPHSMADRILGMGDAINLVKRAQEHIDEDDAKKLENKLRKATFSYDDYLKQIQVVKKMGSFKSLLKMLPGVGKMGDLDVPEGEFKKVEAIILSMTLAERCCKVDLDMSRRRRVAKGSGTSLDDVNKLNKSFKRAKQFFKNMPNMKNLEKMFGGMK